MGREGGVGGGGGGGGGGSREQGRVVVQVAGDRCSFLGFLSDCKIKIP